MSLSHRIPCTVYRYIHIYSCSVSVPLQTCAGVSALYFSQREEKPTETDRVKSSVKGVNGVCLSIFHHLFDVEEVIMLYHCLR